MKDNHKNLPNDHQKVQAYISYSLEVQTKSDNNKIKVRQRKQAESLK